MGQLGIVYHGEEVEYLYAELGAILFSQTGGSLWPWIKKTMIDVDEISSVVIQKDFCKNMPEIGPKSSYCRLGAEDLEQGELADEEETASDLEAIRNQNTRENYLVLNLILKEEANRFIRDLKDELKRLNCTPPIYFLAGSGYLTDSKNISHHPVLTWRSGDALQLLSTATHFHLEDFIYARKQGKTFLFQAVRGNKPRVYQNHCSFRGYELPPWFVKIIQCKDEDFDSTVEYIKRVHGEIPFVCDFERKDQKMEFRRFTTQRDPYDGIFQIPYRKQVFKQVKASEKKKTEEIEKDLRAAMDEYLASNQIVLKNAEFTIARENWQYSLEGIVRLELRVVGVV